MSERLRTGTHTVARGDRVVLRHTDIRSETGGEKRKSTASRQSVVKKVMHIYLTSQKFGKIY
jgi:hypothetical protein